MAQKNAGKELKKYSAMSLDLAALKAGRERLERDKYLDSLWEFTTDLLGYGDLVREVHTPLIRLLEEPDPKFLLLLLPRGSFKSTIASVSYPLWCLAHNPNLRILIDSFKVDRSETFLSEIKQHIESNAHFRDLYGDWKSIPGWASNKISLPHRTKPLKEPSIMCAGINAPVTGGHYDIIIADDLHDENNSQTADQCDKVIRHYKTLYPILEPDHGSLIVIGTRWSGTDLYNHILTSEPVDHA